MENSQAGAGLQEWTMGDQFLTMQMSQTCTGARSAKGLDTEVEFEQSSQRCGGGRTDRIWTVTDMEGRGKKTK